MRFGFGKSLVIANWPALRLRIGLWMDGNDGKSGREVRRAGKDGGIIALACGIRNTIS